MFSDKENVNILTSLLPEYQVSDAVVCPGSRNAPIVHNLEECEDITCHPVTDERSAAFMALGMAQESRTPVVLCVTSGSALLDAAPAVAEAFYQHLPLVIISADRPQQWINQYDGQTMQQNHVLDAVVLKSVSLNEPTNEEEHWYCNRLVCEALAEQRAFQGPVHINVPISEPLYQFTVSELPEERVFTKRPADSNMISTEIVRCDFLTAEKPMIVFGQDDPINFRLTDEEFQTLSNYAVVLFDKLSIDTWRNIHYDEVLAKTQDESYLPDVILYIGNNIVSKRLRQFLRKAKDAKTITIRKDLEVFDTFMNLTDAVQHDPNEILSTLCEDIVENKLKPTAFRNHWQEALSQAAAHAEEFEPAYSEMATVKYFEQQLEDMEYTYQVHYANSMAVRLGNIYASHHIWCNRGINGIDGSISTAAGMSMITDDRIFCVSGDLSFFYDQNALWNKNLGGNLRIIVMNNGGGAIFGKFDALKESQARNMVMGCHETTAQGICTQNDCGYIKATNMSEMQIGIVQLLTMESKRPVVLEVFTDEETDNQMIQEYYQGK